MTPDVSALTSYAGQYKDELFTKMVDAFDPGMDFTVEENVQNSLTLTDLDVDTEPRPFSSTEEIGDNVLDYTPRVLTVEEAKMEMQIDPHKYRTTYLQKARKGIKDEIPYAQFHNESIMADLGAQLNSRVVYYGLDKADFTAFNAGSTYAVGDLVTLNDANGIKQWWRCTVITTAAQSPLTHPAKWQKVTTEAICAGFGLRIADAITAGDLTAIATGAISNSNAVAKIEQMVRDMPVALQKKGFRVYCSYSVKDMYRDDFRERYGKFTGKEQGKNIMLDESATDGIVLHPLTCMGTSQRIICARPEELVVGTNKASDRTEIVTVKSDLWTYKMGVNFLMGTQIRSFKNIRVNNQA